MSFEDSNVRARPVISARGEGGKGIVSWRESGRGRWWRRDPYIKQIENDKQGERERRRKNEKA